MIKVHDKYREMDENSMRMLVSYCAKKMQDDNMWRLLNDSVKHSDINTLCAFLDVYTRTLFQALPKATISKDATLPNASRK